MQQIAIVLGLLAAVAGAIPLAARLNIAYPIVLVLGGLALGFIPVVPNVALDPELVLLVFLPPLLYWEAVNTSWRDFRANIRPIGSLAIGLVIGTTGGVALVGHYLLDLPWAVAFVLGAVVSPTDAVAATAIASRLGLPQRIITIIEGESLINDASALVIYKTAVAAVVAGSFSLPRAGAQFFIAGAVGIAIGIGAGALFSRARVAIQDTRVEGTLSLLIPFLVYLPADLLGASGVLAAVAAGLVMGRKSPSTAAPEARLQIGAIWDLGTFLLNGLAFILIGLEFQEILRALDRDPLPLLLRDIVVVSVTVIVVRIVWVFPSNGLARLIQRKHKREPAAGKRELSVGGLDRPARRDRAGGGPGAAGDGGRRAIPLPQSDHLRHLRGDHRHPCRAGADPPAADSSPRPQQRRQRGPRGTGRAGRTRAGGARALG